MSEFKCEMCKKTFIKGLTDKEAEKQLDKEFPGLITEECDLVCDNCYKKMSKDICPECGEPYNSEYHISDQCVNIAED